MPRKGAFGKVLWSLLMSCVADPSLQGGERRGGLQSSGWMCFGGEWKNTPAKESRENFSEKQSMESKLVAQHAMISIPCGPRMFQKGTEVEIVATQETHEPSRAEAVLMPFLKKMLGLIRHDKAFRGHAPCRDKVYAVGTSVRRFCSGQHWPTPLARGGTW